MKITLTNWERFWLSIIVGGASCPTIQIVRLGNHILDKLEMTNEEKVLVGWQEFGPGRVTWAPEHETHTWELDFAEDEWKLLRDRVEAFQWWPQDRRTEGLYAKLVQDV